ncbi:hypothetical protein [Chitinophaga sp.]|uniref:hypothetical protein n=1 Tax=Chitinophaga sp. TaxID=1869181 RepID=UPI002F95CCE3
MKWSIFRTGKKPSISIQHPSFGLMTYHHRRWLIFGGYFTGAPYFKPVSAKVPLHIVANAEGPTQAQADYFEVLETQYVSLFPEIAPRIKAAAYNGEEEFIFEDFSKDFRLQGMQIYTDKSNAILCELTFATDLAPAYLFHVVLDGLQLKEVVISE